MATSKGTFNNGSNAGGCNNAASYIHPCLAAGGWIQTADTGQTANGSFAAQTGIGAISGYQIWRMNDTLQSTYPVFIKLEYGCASSYASSYYGTGIWLTIGTGSNGAGTITGIILPRTQLAYTGNPTVDNTYNSWVSASNNRLTLCLWAAAVNLITLGIERTKNSLGIDTNEGILFYNSNYNGAMSGQYIPFTKNIYVGPTVGINIHGDFSILGGVRIGL